MRRLLVSLIGMVALAGSTSVAFADSPHFAAASGKVNSDGSLTIAFKEAGLGSNQNIDYLAEGSASVVRVCVNNGGGKASASNKTAIIGLESASATFSSGKNGQITASLVLGPPSSADFTCPTGQTERVASATYQFIALSDVTNDVVAKLGTIASGCLLPNVRGAC